MKRKTRNILLFVVGVGVIIFYYGKHNFEADKQTLVALKTKAGTGDVVGVLQQMEGIESLSNPIVNRIYQAWKREMTSRFITKDEVIENTSNNKIVYEISNFYRAYWREELLKEKHETRTDTLLYKKIVNYLLTNKLTHLTRDSLEKSVKNDSELKRILDQEGFKTKFLFRNGFQDLVIWDQETNEKYEVVLPKDTIKTRVVFLQGYHLNGFDYYASFGASQPGGWASSESAAIYCNKDQYDTSSEHFHVSYLKHESMHFADFKKYPNLSSADLEYRAKVIELMHCTEKTIYDRITDFINGASIDNREHAHPYANYCIIRDLSEELFNSEFESNGNKWKEISVAEINRSAHSLYQQNEAVLQLDSAVTEVVF